MSLDFSKIEENILKFWQENEIFKKTLAKTKNNKPFVFFEGPPTANAKPGIHHVVSRALKDVVIRYKTMQGYYVERKAGWDTHGLPVELEVEKKLNIKGKPGIEKYGIAKFNAECKKNVWQYKKDWEEISERIGFWLDYCNPYITYDRNYIESLWWILKEVWKKELLYQDYKVVPHCPRCGTTLSSHEVAQGYKQVEDISLYLKFPLKNEDKTSFFVWTTTPWTLPGNVAIAIHPQAEYVKVKVDDECLILAEPRLSILENFEVVEKYKGQDLIGKKYEPLYKIAGDKDRAYEVIVGDFITMEDGTGLVHIAPAFGEDDMKVIKTQNLEFNTQNLAEFPILMTVEIDGSVSQGIIAGGKFVKEANLEIIEDLKERNLLWKTEKIEHDYPFCWRCRSPLIYYAKKSWFIKMSQSNIKERLIKNNQKINWIPEFIKNGRFGLWLQEIKDWALSRERYWGTPLPIWMCRDSEARASVLPGNNSNLESKKYCDNIKVIGSFDEIEKLTGKKIEDPHRPFIDEFTFKCDKCGGRMKRVSEVIDCWFDSGAMPFAQHHFPFENEERYEQGQVYPADFIAEGLDQTRGWFYTLLAVSTLLEKEPAYKNVICNGLVLDEKGEKMSKSRGNVVDPWKIINKYGADAVRFYFYSVNQPSDSKYFYEKQIEDIIKRTFLIFKNVVTFYKMYATSNQVDNLEKDDLKNILDKWIVAKLNLLIEGVTNKLDCYDIMAASREIIYFIDDLSTWYLRRSRERFKSEDLQTKNQALKTLRYVIFNLTRLMAPFVPFLAEHIYQEMAGGESSVHLKDWPKVHQEWKNQEIDNQMKTIREIASLGLEQRAKNKLPIRQPLAKMIVKFPGLKKLGKEFEKIINDELNIKKIEYQPSTEKEVELDLVLTPALKEEGIVRELIRQLNDLRKKSGLTIKDKIIFFYQTDKDLAEIIERNSEVLKKQVLAEKIEKKEKLLEKQKEVIIDNQKIFFSYEK